MNWFELSVKSRANESVPVSLPTIYSHSHHVSPKDSLLAIIVGIAGTGKSYLINAIRNLLCDSCAVTATTGKAAYNIHGCTIHSLIQLPVGSKRNKDLNGTNPIRRQTRLKDIRYIVIDEYSMLGQTLLGWIDERCRQATGRTDELFGGKSIILVGDPAQLPPVADWKLLLTRQPSMSQRLTDFTDATRLYYSNDNVANYNFEKLNTLQQPIARKNARHSSAIAKQMNSDDMSGLQPVIFLAKEVHVMLTINLCTNLGLCNGTTGTVVNFIYTDNQQPPDLPIAVIVKFSDYTGPSICDTIPGCVSICPITITCNTLDYA